MRRVLVPVSAPAVGCSSAWYICRRQSDSEGTVLARTKGGSSEDKCIDPSEMILKFNSEMSRCRAMMTAGPTIVLSSGVCRSATLWTRSRLDSHGGKDSSSLDYRDKPCNSRRERCASDFRIPWTAPCGSRAGSVDTCPVRVTCSYVTYGLLWRIASVFDCRGCTHSFPRCEGHRYAAASKVRSSR